MTQRAEIQEEAARPSAGPTRPGPGAPGGGVEIYSTCPQSTEGSGEAYVRHVEEVARWSEEHGCTGTLVYSDNRLVDPWLLSQIVLRSTERLAPLVAVQPVYMHPYTAANMVATLGHMHGRRVCLNMVAGGFKRDLEALNDGTPHDRRYDRLVEYTTIVKRLLAGEEAVSFEGEFYRVKELGLSPALPGELHPEVFVSGSSEAGRAAARVLGATPVKYPEPVGEDEGAELEPGLQAGIRVGIIAREDGGEAWSVAHRRFPPDREGQLTHKLAMKVSDSVWHRKLSRMAERRAAEDDPYWLVPFENYKSMCPYLVGSYERVAGELARYVELGYRKFILDIPPSEEALRHTGETFRRAVRRAGAPDAGGPEGKGRPSEAGKEVAL